MNKTYIILLIILVSIMISCGARKSETKKENTNATTNISSKEEEKTSETLNVKVKSDVSVSEDGFIRTRTTTITPIDNSKPAEIVDKHGKKLNISNSKYVEEEREEIIKKNKKDNTITSISDIKNEDTSKSLKVDSEYNNKSKEKVTEKESSFRWYFLFIPIVLLAGCYAYYKTTPTARLFSMFKNT
jgi:hypothetical protein